MYSSAYLDDIADDDSEQLSSAPAELRGSDARSLAYRESVVGTNQGLGLFGFGYGGVAKSAPANVRIITAAGRSFLIGPVFRYIGCKSNYSRTIP